MEAVRRWMERTSRGVALDISRDRAARFVQDFVKFAGEKEQYDKQDVINYINALRARGQSPNSIKTAWYYVKSFFKANNWPWEFDKRETPKKVEPRRELLTFDQMKAILDTAQKEDPTLYLALRLAITLGCRRAETTLFKRSEYRRPQIYHKAVKGGKSGWRVLDDGTCYEIETYMKMRSTNSDYLLVDGNGSPINEKYLDSGLRSILKELGIHKQHLGWHAIRRGLVTELHRKGMSEKELTDLIGWQTPTMVAEYIRLDRKEVEDKAKRLHPLMNHSRPE